MSKELDALNKVSMAKVFIGKEGTVAYTSFKNTKQFAIIELSLKALEILRTKRVDIAHLQDSKDYAEYNEVIGKLATLWRVLPLTEEEYKLLKAIL